MDRTLALLQNADPADPTPDSAELTQLEGINSHSAVKPLAHTECQLELSFYFLTVPISEQMHANR